MYLSGRPTNDGGPFGTGLSCLACIALNCGIELNRFMAQGTCGRQHILPIGLHLMI